MKPSVESGISIILMQKEELKEGTIDMNCKVLMLEIPAFFFSLNKQSSVEHPPVF